jgi:hypothetical protein
VLTIPKKKIITSIIYARDCVFCFVLIICIHHTFFHSSNNVISVFAFTEEAGDAQASARREERGFPGKLYRIG